MGLFATSSLDGTVNIYTLAHVQFLRTIRHPAGLPIHSVVLAQSPLACVAFFSKADRNWVSFGINGVELEKQREEV